MRIAKLLLLACTCSLLLGNPKLIFCQAQATSSLQGTVYDKNGAVVGGAQVTVTSATGLSRSVNTTDQGTYRVDQIPAGRYTVKVSKQGFAVATAENVETLVNSATTQDFKLNPGGISQTVEVTAAAPVADVTKTSESSNITPREVQELPMVSRDIGDLAYLAPGVR